MCTCGTYKYYSVTPTRLARQGTTLEESYLFRTILDEDDVYTNVVEHFQPWEASIDPMRGTVAHRSAIPSNRSFGVDKGNLALGTDKGS